MSSSHSTEAVNPPAPPNSPMRMICFWGLKAHSSRRFSSETSASVEIAPRASADWLILAYTTGTCPRGGRGGGRSSGPQVEGTGGRRSTVPLISEGFPVRGGGRGNN